MDGKKANACVTDPPYNIDYEGTDGKKIKNDNMSDADFYNFLYGAFANIYKNLADGGAFYCFHSYREKLNFNNAAENAKFKIEAECIWVKNSIVLGRSDYQNKYEPVIYAIKPTAENAWYGGANVSNLWYFNKPTRNDTHPTMKPLDLIAFPIKNSTEPNSIVLDPFGGSGSTLIASDQFNRTCYMCELDEKYANVIVKRYLENGGKEGDVFVERGDKKLTYREAMKC
jgi:DNA modification methylase